MHDVERLNIKDGRKLSNLFINYLFNLLSKIHDYLLITLCCKLG